MRNFKISAFTFCLTLFFFFFRLIWFNVFFTCLLMLLSICPKCTENHSHTQSRDLTTFSSVLPVLSSVSQGLWMGKISIARSLFWVSRPRSDSVPQRDLMSTQKTSTVRVASDHGQREKLCSVLCWRTLRNHFKCGLKRKVYSINRTSASTLKLLKTIWFWNNKSANSSEHICALAFSLPHLTCMG